jgi:hypothetical protein
MIMTGARCAASYASAGTFTVDGTASVTVPETGRGVAVKAVTATVGVTDAPDR